MSEMAIIIAQDSWKNVTYKLVTPEVYSWVIDGYEESVLTEQQRYDIISTMWEKNQSELKLHDHNQQNFIERLLQINDNDERADYALGKSFNSLAEVFKYVAENNISVTHDFMSI